MASVVFAMWQEYTGWDSQKHKSTHDHAHRWLWIEGVLLHVMKQALLRTRSVTATF